MKTREYKRHDKSCCGLSSKKLANRSDPSDLKVRSLANSVNLLLMVSALSNTTPRLRAELQKGMPLWTVSQNSRKI